MYQSKSKIIKNDGSKPTEIEEDVGKSLQQLQMSKDDLKVHLNQITITNVDLVEYKQRDGTMSKALHVKIPFRCTPAYVKVSHQIIEHLEDKFKWPVIITANRTIQSKRAKHHPSQQRPRSRTLKHVQDALLHDICVPSSVVGRSTRVTLDGKKHVKILLDPLDRDDVEEKIDAMAHIYQAMTTHKIDIDFAKPNSYQKRTIEAKKAKQ